MAVERIPFAKGKAITLDGVPEFLGQIGVGKKRIDSERALQYGRSIVSLLTYALTEKVHNLDLRRHYKGDSWSFDYGHLRLQSPPSVRWGVVGIDLVAGTVAAELALQQEAAKVGYTSELVFPDGVVQPGHEEFDRVWAKLTITNPELQSTS